MAESPAKKTRTGGYYKTIDGEKYCRSLLNLAEEYLADGQISYAEAKQLWDSALDGPGITSIESATLKYSLKTQKYTEKAQKFLQGKLKEFQEVESKDFDRDLIKKAEAFVKDGQISNKEAEELWKAASNGNPTVTQRKTLEFSLKNHKYTEKAEQFLKDSLRTFADPYVRINNVRYDRELLHMVGEFAKDGRVSYPEARRLWKVAQDGKGVSMVEKRTLLYSLEQYNYTGKAAKFLREALGVGPENGVDVAAPREAPRRFGSMNDFEYAEFAGETKIDDSKVSARDQYGNAKNADGNCFDLVRDGACDGHEIVLIDCSAVGGAGTNDAGVLGEGARQALRQKGFKLNIWGKGLVEDDKHMPPKLQELSEALESASQLWVVSNDALVLTDEICTIIKDFYEEGHGLFILGDNDPWNKDANFLLRKILPGVSMSGNYCGAGQVLKEAPSKKTGFHKHLITTGLESMYEGHTIAEVTGCDEDFKRVATSSASTVVTAAYDVGGKRALVDGGFTRLFLKWDTAGTDRFVVNAAAWLVNIERLAGR